MKPPGTEGDNYYYWNAAGYDMAGKKTEHHSPDLRKGKTGFIQSSTHGYIGHYIVKDTEDIDVSDGLPSMLRGQYYVYQGTTDVTDKIELGGAGKYADGYDARTNIDRSGVVKNLNDIDGMEVIYGCDGNAYIIMQEDSGSVYGERCLISSPIEYDDDGEELTWYFVAMSGGSLNTRMMEGVGIPAGVNGYAGGHEFSGIFDMSGFFYEKNNGEFALKAKDDGYMRREYEAEVCINDKDILLVVQAHNFREGVIAGLQCDRGGQWMIYKPELPFCPTKD